MIEKWVQRHHLLIMVRSRGEFFRGHVTHGKKSLRDDLADRQKAVAEAQQAVEQST